jgi:hypothetical protein
MSTAIAPAKLRHGRLPGTLLTLASGVTLTGAYMLQYRVREYHAAHPADPPFWQPGPPADLLTMLERGLTFGPGTPEPLPQEAQVTVAKAICQVIVTDYHPYRYGSTPGNLAQQARVNQEAEQLVEQVSQLYADKSTARRDAKYALAALANSLRNEFHDLDPGQGCKMIEPILNNPTTLLF